MAAAAPLLGEGEVPPSPPLPLLPMQALLYDTVNSYYCGVARMALYETGTSFQSQYVSMPSFEQTAPWFARLNPNMQLPTLLLPSGAAVTDSRDIVTSAYGGQLGTASEEEVLDKLYSEDAGSLAWLTGRETIPLLRLGLRAGMQGQARKKLEKRQREAPDLHDLYAKKIEMVSKKHFTKSIEDVAFNLQQVMDFLEATLARTGGPWLLGAQHGRADAVATAWLQWIVRCNEYGAAVVAVPPSVQEYLCRLRARPAYQHAIGQYERDAFVLHMLTTKQRKAALVLLFVAVLILLLAYRAKLKDWMFDLADLIWDIV